MNVKKSALALAVAALSATVLSTSASATTVYDKDGTSMAVGGRIQAVYYSDKWSPVEDEGSISTTGRLNLDLRTQLTSNIAAFAFAEWEAANGENVPDEEDGFDARYMWVGADFGLFGQVKAGKFEEAIKYAISPTDFFEDAGCTGLAGNDDRRETVLQYQWSGYGVDAFISYAFARDNEHLDGAYFNGENVDLDYSWSAALGYTSPDILFGPIGVRVGYLAGEFADGETAGVLDHPNNTSTGLLSGARLDEYSQWAVSAFWGSLEQGPYVAAAYQSRQIDYNYDAASGMSSDDYTVSGYEFTVAYTFANGIKLATGYEAQTLEMGDGLNDLDAATVPVLVMWNITPNVDVWAEARFDAGTDDDEGASNENFDLVAGTSYAENVFSLGMRYNF